MPSGVLRSLVALALLLLAPVASAADTLTTFQEPREGIDQVFPFTLLPEEAERPHALIYRNAIRSPFNLTILDEAGVEVFGKAGGRGAINFPELAPGEYRFFVRGSGEFQVTDQFYIGTAPPESLSENLTGTDAYVFALPDWYNLTLEGNVSAELFEVAGGKGTLSTPLRFTIAPRSPVVLTLRGEEGAAYTFSTVAIEAPPPPPTPTDETPGPALGALLAAVVAVALVARRR